MGLRRQRLMMLGRHTHKSPRSLTLDLTYIVDRSEGTMRTTFTLELRMDVADEEQLRLMHRVLKTAAQGLFAQAVMLAGKKAPQIALKSENSFMGQTEIELHNEDDGA